MNKDSLEFLKDLIEAPSPSGYEQPAARVVRRRRPIGGKRFLAC